MIVHICDRCKQKLNTYKFHISYSGNNSIDLCENCAKNFKNWLDIEDTGEESYRAPTEPIPTVPTCVIPEDIPAIKRPICPCIYCPEDATKCKECPEYGEWRKLRY